MRTRSSSSSSPVPSVDFVHEKSRVHRSVLLHEVVHALDIQEDDIVIDATLGAAGHAEALLKGLGGNGLFVGFDADPSAIERSRARLKNSLAAIHLVHGNFRNIAGELAALNVGHITKTLFDLGWSSYQLDSRRGFSFREDEPLLMTFGEDQALTAAIIVNTWSEQTLADIFYGFGGERYSRRIARRIVEKRKNHPINTTKDLVDIIQEATPPRYRRGRIHPATRTFQALRIAVNDELGALGAGLEGAWKLTAAGGRIAVITFHSLEDRIVKRTFADLVKKGDGKLHTKKPITPSREEIRENPRARSAKLRVIEKGKFISHESSHTKNKQIRPLDISGET